MLIAPFIFNPFLKLNSSKSWLVAVMAARSWTGSKRSISNMSLFVFVIYLSLCLYVFLFCLSACGLLICCRFIVWCWSLFPLLCSFCTSFNQTAVFFAWKPHTVFLADTYFSSFSTITPYFFMSSKSFGYISLLFNTNSSSLPVYGASKLCSMLQASK